MVFCDQTNFVLVLVTEEGRVAVLKVLEMLPDFLSSPRVLEVKCENLIDLF